MTRPARATRRRRILWSGAAAIGSAGLLAALLPSVASATAPTAQGIGEQPEQAVYQSRPDILQAPVLTTHPTGQEDPGLLLTTPSGANGSGAAIYDNSGQLVWYAQGMYSNLKEITWQGQPALAAVIGGRAVVLDSTYTEIASFRMSGYDADFHTLAFNEDTSRVLMTAYVGVPFDLSPWGGSASATVMDVVIQEVDTATGAVTFEWAGLDHISPDESTQPLNGAFVDYVHANSVAYDNDGNVLLSSRHTSTIYKIDIGSGDIVWRFGGENSDFTFPDPYDMPSYQHDASRLPDGRLTAFDNGVGRSPQASRGSVWELDEQAMTAELAADLQPDAPIFGMVMGSHQPTATGNRIVNFGDAGQIVEFNGDQVVFTASFGDFDSYKVERTTSWVGTPATSPDVAWAGPEEDGSRDLYMSWNGATEVDSWRVEARPAGGGGFELVETVERTGFETAADVAAPEDAETLRVSALDDDGRVLGTTTLREGIDATIAE